MNCVAQAVRTVTVARQAVPAGSGPSHLAELALGILLISLAIGVTVAIAALVAWLAVSLWLSIRQDAPSPPRPACPYCGFLLRRIEVQDLANPFPSMAKWWFDTEDCPGQCFGDPDQAGKPDPIPEV